MADETVVIVQQPSQQVSVAVGAPTPIVVAAPGPQGTPGASGATGATGPAGGSVTFVFNQSSASSSWLIHHNLGQYPSVTVVDSAGTLVDGDITYVDSNTVRVDFNAGFAGVAYLN